MTTATKVCPHHGVRDQVGIYCSAPMGTRLSCGAPLVSGDAARAGCPDGGYCHHDCAALYRGACWRVSNAGPLSGVYVGDAWPARVRVQQQMKLASEQEVTMDHAEVEFYVDDAGEHRWRVRGANGETVIPPEGHTSEADAVRAFVRAVNLAVEAHEHI